MTVQNVCLRHDEWTNIHRRGVDSIPGKRAKWSRFALL